ncbi:hypothetical protein [Alicyclobacillus sacchari]|uniref:hypothetical protein n=1 Tax=Alicyclobacillus sacchari TaxID=392010 RepID=UPI003C7AAAB2
MLFTLICLVGFKLSSVKTAGLSYILSVLIAAIHWKFYTSAKSIMLASVKGLLLALIVIYVLVFGLFLYNVLREGRAMDVFFQSLRTLCTNPCSTSITYFCRVRTVP